LSALPVFLNHGTSAVFVLWPDTLCAIYHYNTSAPSLAASGLVVELATLLRRNVNVPPPPGMTEAPL